MATQMVKPVSAVFLVAIIAITSTEAIGSTFQTVQSTGQIVYCQHGYTRPEVPSDVYAAWRTKEERLNLWKDLWHAHGLSDRIVKLGESVEGRDILMFDCGNPTCEVMLLDAELHGNEDHPGEVLLMFAYWLFESGDRDAQRILQQNRLLFVPTVNVDRFDRVNARSSGEVNLNRNFVYGWGQSGDNQPGSDDYRGPSAGSEPETQAMRKAFDDYQPRVYVNFHVGAFMARGYGNSTLGDAILATATSFRAFFGATTGSGHGCGGFAVADAVDLSGDCCAWLVEFFGASTSDPHGNGWKHTEWHLDQLEDVYYPVIKELITSSCSLIEDS